MGNLLGHMKGEEGSTTALFLDARKLRFKLPRCLHLYACAYPSIIYLSIHPAIQPSSLSIHLSSVSFHPSNYHLSLHPYTRWGSPISCLAKKISALLK